MWASQGASRAPEPLQAAPALLSPAAAPMMPPPPTPLPSPSPTLPPVASGVTHTPTYCSDMQGIALQCIAKHGIAQCTYGRAVHFVVAWLAGAWHSRAQKAQQGTNRYSRAKYRFSIAHCGAAGQKLPIIPYHTTPYHTAAQMQCAQLS